MNEQETDKAPDSAQPPLIVNLPDQGYSKNVYVNTRGAALNYIIANASNEESAHCSDRSD